MKIIDLLNKIANGEEVPEKFKIKGINRFFHYNNYEKWFDDINDKYYCKGAIELRELNDEVEVIEEPQEHKIPEKLTKTTLYGVPILNKKELSNITLTNKRDIVDIKDKINEILDYLEEKE